MAPEQKKKFTEEEREEIKAILHETLVEFFTNSGKIGRNIIVTTAIIVTSLIAIGGGFKMLLGWMGFSYIGGKL